MSRKKVKRKLKYQHIPTQLTEDQFNEFVLPHLSTPKHGPNSKVPMYRLFNYMLKVLHTGMQWSQLPIELADEGKPEIHYTRVFRIYQRWCQDDSFEAVFENTVHCLHNNGLLDLSVMHGDGTTTAAKKGGDNIGYSGHKHFIPKGHRREKK